MPKVSIIMPTYNRSWIINRAISSILHQTFSDFELIIIDDASADDTEARITKYKDNRIIYRRLRSRKGPPGARNEGIKTAQGELIAYLDSDNIWYPNYLEVMTQELTSFYIMAYSGQNTFLVSGNKKHLKVIGRKVRNHDYNPLALTRINYIDISSTIHRRSIFDEIGCFNEKLQRSLEDWDLFVRIVMKYPFRVKHVNQVLGEYYYFLKGTEATIENNRFSNEKLLQIFDLGKPGEYETPIIRKINKIIGY